MAEYISRDWLLTHTHTGMDTIQMMQTMIDAPAADVVEVVRCWECKFAEYIGPMDYICRRKGGCFHGREFCSYGERKMDGGADK